MVTHYGDYVRDMGVRAQVLCGQYAGGFGNTMSITLDIGKVSCEKCLKKLKEKSDV